MPAKKKNGKNKMKRNASKRDERHGRSRYQPTKVLEFVKLILRPLKVAKTEMTIGRVEMILKREVLHVAKEPSQHDHTEEKQGSAQEREPQRVECRGLFLSFSWVLNVLDVGVFTSCFC